MRRGDSIKDRWSKQFREIHRASMRHRSIVLDSNDADLLRLRLAYAKEAAETIEEVSIECPGHYSQ